jgi:hypothetical protein
VIRLFGWCLAIVGAVCAAGLAVQGASTLGAWVITAAGAIVALAPEAQS